MFSRLFQQRGSNLLIYAIEANPTSMFPRPRPQVAPSTKIECGDARAAASWLAARATTFRPSPPQPGLKEPSWEQAEGSLSWHCVWWFGFVCLDMWLGLNTPATIPMIPQQLRGFYQTLLCKLRCQTLMYAFDTRCFGDLIFAKVPGGHSVSSINERDMFPP